MKTLVILLMLVPSLARAQYTNPYTGTTRNNPGSSLIDTMLQQRMNARILDIGKKSAAKHQPIERTDFRGNGKRATTATIVEQLAPAGEQRQALATAVDGVYAEFEKGARKNNVANALAFLVGAAMSIDRGTTFTDAQSDELVAGTNDLLAGSADFVKASAADKQKIYETFVTLGGLMLLYQELGKTDAQSAKAAKALAAQSLAMLGIR